MAENNSKHLIIHGHFYQPPRENPWTERIDQQESAHPYHDWNERIARECYMPNTRSRLLDEYGRITDMVNNYEWISFNFGPTLLRWMEDMRPEIYSRILEADARSAKRLNGHGNAIAQIYNHIIMPLASVRDQETEIKWAIYDFERRFHRSPEGIWLSETAINSTTLDILIGFGFRFIILSPHQAEAVRPIGEDEWTDVSDGSINIGRAYRAFRYTGKRGSKRSDDFIDIFFYHAGLAQDISFNHLLSNGDVLAERIDSVFDEVESDLVTVATDGEVYGHHEPFADMALAYLVSRASAGRRITMTNFASYLEAHETTYEVRLKPGPNGEGTSWSCFHGVGRWKEDCGCKIDPVRNWNQKWRSPLRNGLNELRDSLAGIFADEGGKLLKDPWKARNEYVEIIDTKDLRLIEEFVKKRMKGEKSPERITRALELLESQRNALLMFTSCGWFFDDISGIETVQILLYAARAIELAGPEHSGILEEHLLETLAEAKSNIPSGGTGADIYRRSVAIARVNKEMLTAYYAVLSHLFGPAENSGIFGYAFEPIADEELESNRRTTKTGLVHIRDPYTLSSSYLIYLVTIEEDSGFTSFVKDTSTNSVNVATDRYRVVRKRLCDVAKKSDLGEGAFRAAVKEIFDREPFTLNDMFEEERTKVIGHLTAKRLNNVYDAFAKIYDETKALLVTLKDYRMKPPQSLLVPAEAILNRQLTEEVSRWERSLEHSSLIGIKRVIQEAAQHGIEIDRSAASHSFTELVLEQIERAVESRNANLVDAILNFVELSTTINVKLDESTIQDRIFEHMEKIFAPGEGETMREEKTAKKAGSSKKKASRPGRKEAKFAERFVALAERFNFGTSKWLGDRS